MSTAHRPLGFALVRGLTDPVRTLNSFFVVRPARGAGIGSHAVAVIVANHPGPWQVAFQDANPAATPFWRQSATRLAGSDWTEERRAVPGRPDLPPDVWITFTASPGKPVLPARE